MAFARETLGDGFEGGHWNDVWRRAEKGRSVTRYSRHATGAYS